MTPRTLLVVNADDFGQSPRVNRGIVRAHLHGIITSASLMVRWPSAPDAVELSSKCPSLGLGLHLDLGEWSYENGDWIAKYEVVPCDQMSAVRTEMIRQIDEFRRLVGRDPAHVDSHQHIHMRKAIRPIALELARQLGVPLRQCNDRIRYCGDFYGQDIDGSPLHDRICVEGLLGILANLEPGITEMCCHPSDGVDLDTMYAKERETELATLCDRRVKASIEKLGIRLCSFKELGR